MGDENRNQGQWLKLHEAAFTLGVSEITLRRRIKSGKIEHRLHDGKYYIFIEKDQFDDKNQIEEPVFSAPRAPTLSSSTLHNYRRSSEAAPRRQERVPNREPDFSERTTRQIASNPFESSGPSDKVSTATEYLERQILKLQTQIQEKDSLIVKLRREFEDQQTLIAFLEDKVKHQQEIIAEKQGSKDTFPYRII